MSWQAQGLLAIGSHGATIGPLLMPDWQNPA
jgi:hypothetical protein